MDNGASGTCRVVFDEAADELVRALKLAKGRHGEAARILGINRSTLWRRIKRYGVSSFWLAKFPAICTLTKSVYNTLLTRSVERPGGESHGKGAAFIITLPVRQGRSVGTL